MPTIIRIECKIVARMVVDDEIYKDKERMQKNYKHLRKMISNKIETISDEDLKNLPIEIKPFY